MRKEITQSIVDLLKAQNTNTLQLAQDEDHLSYVIWFDDDGYGYDCIVKAISIDDTNNIEIDVYNFELGAAHTAYSRDGDIACTNVQWLTDILSSMYYTLTEKQQNNGK